MLRGTKDQARLRLASVGGIRIDESSARPRRVGPPRKRPRVHRKKHVYGKVLAFPLDRINNRTPVLRGDPASLPGLLQSPLMNPGISGHVGDGVPAVKNISNGLHAGLIALDYMSSKGPTTLPVTPACVKRTIRPMSRTVTPTQFKKGFCQRLKAARIHAGFEQEDIAKALNVLPNTYSKYEKRTLMPHHLIPSACELLGIEMGYLYGEMTRRRKMAAGDLHAT